MYHIFSETHIIRIICTSQYTDGIVMAVNELTVYDQYVLSWRLPYAWPFFVASISYEFSGVFLCEAGYRIAIVLIDNTPSVAKERSMSRFMKEGRYADDSYIEAPFKGPNKKRLGGLFFPTEMTCKKRWVFYRVTGKMFRTICKIFFKSRWNHHALS